MKCPVCAGTDFTDLLWNVEGMHVFLCKTCHIYVEQKITVEVITNAAVLRRLLLMNNRVLRDQGNTVVGEVTPSLAEVESL